MGGAIGGLGKILSAPLDKLSKMLEKGPPNPMELLGGLGESGKEE
jgi:hypothetical protein